MGIKIVIGSQGIEQFDVPNQPSAYENQILNADPNRPLNANELKQYPPCQFLVRNPLTWNPTITSAADLVDCATLQINARVLCLSGTNAGIWIATSATSMVLDPNFTVQPNWTH